MAQLEVLGSLLEKNDLLKPKILNGYPPPKDIRN